MAESAALLVDEVLPEQPMRQWVLSFPFQPRFLFARRPTIMGQVLGIVYRVIAKRLVKNAGLTHKTARTGAVTLIQRFDSAPNLNIDFHMLFLDGGECGGTVKVIACIEDPAVIKKILTHLKGQAAPEPAGLLPSVRAPPLISLQRTGRPVGRFD